MNVLIIYGVVGGLVLRILELLELPNVPEEDRPNFRDWIYWLPFVFWPIIGGFLVHLYLADGCDLTPRLAFHIGLASPLVIRLMASATPFGYTAEEVSDDA
ncbi:MAG: hypothetical protein ACYS4W_11075 [Planctomycetota bacterium]|jgi:hypothetical protein